MSAENFFSTVRSLFHREPADRILDEAAASDLSDELQDEDLPKFNKLKVVVSGETDDGEAGQAGRSRPAPVDPDSPPRRSSGARSPVACAQRCEACGRQREAAERSRAVKKLALAAVLYCLFMVGELIGKRLGHCHMCRISPGATDGAGLQRGPCSQCASVTPTEEDAWISITSVRRGQSECNEFLSAYLVTLK